MSTILTERACTAYRCLCRTPDAPAHEYWKENQRVACPVPTLWGGATRYCTRPRDHAGEHYCCGRVSWRDGEKPQRIDWADPNATPTLSHDEVAVSLKQHVEAHPGSRRLLRDLILKTRTVVAPCGCKVRVPVNRFVDEYRHRQCRHGVWRVELRKDLETTWTQTRRAARNSGKRMAERTGVREVAP